MKIEKRIHNKELEIIVEGRLDANTSPELDKVLSNISGIDSLIINANEDIKDIFDVTGFSSIFNIA